MWRRKLPRSEIAPAALEDLGRRVAEAIARGEVNRARELIEEAISLGGRVVPPSRGSTWWTNDVRLVRPFLPAMPEGHG